MSDDNLDDIIALLIDTDENETAKETVYIPGGKPVSLTERAALQVEKIIEQDASEEELFLRVAVEGGGCSGLSYKLDLDKQTDEDEVFENYGVKILVNKNHIMYLEGIQIDYPDGLDARGFIFNNPQASESCGCGTSFAV